MESIASGSRSVRTYVMVGILSLLSVFLFSCAAGTKYMIEQNTKPPIAPKADKAVLVIVRTTSLGWAITIDNYIDGKMIGQTRGKSYFMAEVTPGSHFVMAKAENVAAARINFEAGRVYFLDQSIYPGFWTMRTGYSTMTKEDALKQVNESGCDYRVYDTKNPGPDMDAKDYNETKADFEKEVKEDPKRHKDILEYKGYNKL